MIPFYNSVNGGPPEPITALTPTAWYRYGVGITSAGGLVSAWADQSGNANDLLQATGTNQPALQSDNSILFDGSDNYLRASFTLDQPNTTYFLIKQVTWTSGDSIVGGVTSQSVFQTVATPSLRINAGTSVATNSGLAIGAWGVVAAVFNGASSLLQINNGTPATGNAGTNNAGGVTAGAAPSLGSFGNVEIKEAIVFATAHDAATRTTVITYLATVGGINL